MYTCNVGQLAAPFGPFPREKNRQISAKNALLIELTIDNSGAADWVAQLWDVAAAGDIGGADADSDPDYEIVVPAGSYVPFRFDAEGYQFHRGLYVRCVTAIGGSTAIANSEAKFSGRMISPYPICV